MVPIPEFNWFPPLCPVSPLTRYVRENSPGAPLTISAWRATGSRVSVTDVEVELNLMAEVVAGRNEAMRGVALMACLKRSEADIVV